MSRHLTVVFPFLMCLTTGAVANPIILAPSGITLTTGQVRAEAALSPGNGQGKYFWLAAGLQQVELDLIRFDQPHGDAENLFGAQWNFLPETSFNPAVGFGVTDIASNSQEGIGGYLAVTKHLPIGAASRVLRSFALTAGVGLGGIRGPFFGFEAELPVNFFALGEYDSRDLNATVGWQPIKYFKLKAYTIRGEFYYGAEIPPITF